MSQNSMMDLSSQREDRSRLSDRRPWMTSVQMSLFLFLECTAALRWQIAAVSDRVSQKLRCSRLPDKKVPVHSNIGTSEWRSWKLSFVALATNEGCATLAWCDRISEYQWWTVLPRSGHSADVAGVLRWHRTVVLLAHCFYPFHSIFSTLSSPVTPLESSAVPPDGSAIGIEPRW